MTPTEKRLDAVDWREIDGAIMDFQMHVRKITGGNDLACVDSTELKSAIKSFLTTKIAQAIAEDRARVRVREEIENTPIDKAHTYSSENADEYRGFDNGQESYKQKLLASLDTPTDK